MNKTFLILISLLILQSCQETKISYLKENRFDLTSDTFDFPQKDFNIIGFGAYHGSAETENVELKLLKSLTQNGTIGYYIPEVDYSTAHYYNQYLKTGDTTLLKDLVIFNGYHTPQERTIEYYKKWKKLKELNDLLPNENKIEVLGLEWIRNYKYTTRHILEFVNNTDNSLSPINDIEAMVKVDTTSYAIAESSLAYKNLNNLINDYANRKDIYKPKIKNLKQFEFILSNIQNSFLNKPEREKIVFENYLALDSIHSFKNNPPFVRIGFFHIEKSREGQKGYPSFFARLIENEIYPKEKVLSIIGYLTESTVVWDEKYDENGNYTGHTIEAGYGIGDYEKEYFRGIQNLKDTKISDKTLFRLNKKESPFSINEPDLIEIVMTDEKSNGEDVNGMSTLDFLDYAVLISNSKASTPIFEMK
jgi:hypothetical protein